jgi:hypothetical protein
MLPADRLRHFGTLLSIGARRTSAAENFAVTPGHEAVTSAAKMMAGSDEPGPRSGPG